MQHLLLALLGKHARSLHVPLQPLPKHRARETCTERPRTLLGHNVAIWDATRRKSRLKRHALLRVYTRTNALHPPPGAQTSRE